MKSYALIVNPASGRGRALRKAEALRKALSAWSSVDVLETTQRGAAMELAASAAGNVDRVFAVGGDGTLNEVVGGLMSTGLVGDRLPELGFLPAGTANAAMRAFRIGSDPVSVAKALPSARSRPLDVGLVRHQGGERAFLLWCGAGWDAVVIDVLNAQRSGLMGVSGMVGHVPRLLRAFARYDQPPIEAEVDGKAFGKHSSVIVANIGEIAFGGLVADRADPGDGRFNVVGVPHLSVARSLRLASRMMTSSLTRGAGVEHRLGGQITVRSDGDVPFQLDGEPVGRLPMTVRLVPGALKLLCT